MKYLIDRIYDKMSQNFTKWDYGLLKTYGAIFGLLVGAYFPEIIKQGQFVLLSIFLIILFRYIYLLFIKKS